MFRIESIQLNEQEPIVFSYPSCFIYGENDVGKTLLFEILDYMMGSSEKSGIKEIWKKEGMSNVNKITMVLSSSNKKVFLQRTIDHELFYKWSENDCFSLINRERYIEIIQQFFSNPKKYYDDYSYAVSEKLSFRGLSYLNFIDENSIGWIDPIFREAREVQDARRIHDQMAFFFDFETLKQMVKKQKELEKTENSLSKISLSVEKENFIRGRIKKDFNSLNIEFSDQMSENEDNFKNYLLNLKNDKKKKKTKEESDLIFLLTMSAELENQLNASKSFEKQTNSLIDYTEKTNLLLNFLKNAIHDSDEFTDYYNSINELLKCNSNDLEILSSKDYSKTIEKIEEKKKEIDDKISQIRQSLSKLNYVEREAIVSDLNSMFKEYKTISNISEYETLAKKIRDLKEDLKMLNRQFKGKINDSMNNLIMTVYSKLKNGKIDFAVEDYLNPNFKLLFVPSNSSVVSLKSGSVETNESKSYVSGSKARHTTWQLLTYLSLISFIRTNFEDFPLAPLLIVDAIQEPFDDVDVLEKFYHIFSDECRAKGIQLIVTSARKLNTDNPFDLDLTEGLNREITH